MRIDHQGDVPLSQRLEDVLDAARTSGDPQIGDTCDVSEILRDKARMMLDKAPQVTRLLANLGTDRMDAADRAAATAEASPAAETSAPPADVQAALKALEPGGLASLTQALAALSPDALAELTDEVAALEAELAEALGDVDAGDAAGASDGAGEAAPSAGGPTGAGSTHGQAIDGPEAQKRASIAVSAAEAEGIAGAAGAEAAQALEGAAPVTLGEGVSAPSRAERILAAGAAAWDDRDEALSGLESASARVKDASLDAEDRLAAASELLAAADALLDEIEGAA